MWALRGLPPMAALSLADRKAECMTIGNPSNWTTRSRAIASSVRFSICSGLGSLDIPFLIAVSENTNCESEKLLLSCISCSLLSASSFHPIARAPTYPLSQPGSRSLLHHQQEERHQKTPTPLSAPVLCERRETYPERR